MALDFEDALDAARAAGWRTVSAFALRATGDLAMSLVREWASAGRLATAAVTAAVTLALWGLALRPWMWNWDVQPGPPAHARAAPPVTEVELLALAAAAMLPVLVVLLFTSRLVKRRA
jgi:hypothetical protein